jgi:transposase, IS5 family
MPIANITSSQKQGRLFGQNLSEELDRKNKLYQLRELINWSELEIKLSSKIKISKYGRTKICPRIMLGLSMLQAMYNLSDRASVEQFEENIYWQYFCGYEYLEQNIGVSEASIRRFRRTLGEDGYEIILQELIKIGGRIGIYKKKDLESIIVDTTVQIKSIKHPHDVHLMEKARLEIVKLCQKLGIKLNETYAKTFKKDTLKLWKYKEDSKALKRKKIMKSLKIRLGRIIRICERNVEANQIELCMEEKEILSRVKKIHKQSVLNQAEKKQYKQENDVIYSFAAPEVECIGKGKMHKPYEFGNKVSIAVSGRGNFVLCAKSFHGNPYDGHTLLQTVQSVEALTSIEVQKIFVDLGYRGSNVREKGKVYTPYTKKKLDNFEKKMIKRRSAIEPIIGHLKHYGRMAKNYLKGIIGDMLNPIISAVGLNLRCLANHLPTGANLKFT